MTPIGSQGFPSSPALPSPLQFRARLDISAGFSIWVSCHVSPHQNQHLLLQRDKLLASQRPSAKCFAKKGLHSTYDQTCPSITNHVHSVTKTSPSFDELPAVTSALSTLQQVKTSGEWIGSLQHAHANFKVPIRLDGDSSLMESFWSSMALKFLVEEWPANEEHENGDILDRHMDNFGVHVSGDVLHFLVDKCISRKDLRSCRSIYCFVVRCGQELNNFLGSHLIHMFASCGSLPETNRLFKKLAKPDIYAWSAIISAHTRLGHDEQSIKLYHVLQQSQVKLDGHIFSAVLKACAGIGDIVEGQLIHTQIIQIGLEEHLFVGNSLIDMYSKCGKVQAACCVLDRLPERDIVTWNSLIAGLAQHKSGQETFQAFQQMQQEGIHPNQVTFVNILKACASTETSLDWIAVTHAHAVETGFEADIFVGNTLIDMYSKCGNIDYAQRVFKRLSNRDVVTWNAMIAGYAQHGHIEEACQLFKEMCQDGFEPDEITFASALQSCAKLAALDQGRAVHAHAIECGFDAYMYVGNTLIDMYCQCSSFKDASRMFNKLPKQDVVSWNAMIAGHAQNGCGEKAFELLLEMQQSGLTPNQVTCLSILNACLKLEALKRVYIAHINIIEYGFELDILVGSTLIGIYSQCGSLEHAFLLFKRLPKLNVQTWNAMIAGYAQHGNGEEAAKLLLQMPQEGVEPASELLLSCLKALTDVEQGKYIHQHIIRIGLDSYAYIVSTLIDMYARGGALDDAQAIFEHSKKQDVEIWSAMIAACAYNGHGNYGLRLFYCMLDEGIEPHRHLFISILRACSSIAALDEGKLIHAYILESGLQMDATIGNILIDMYVKCGSPKDAHSLLEKFLVRDVVTWNTMISGYCQHGQAPEALQLFQQMQEDGVKPDQITYVSILRIFSSLAYVFQGKLVHGNIIGSGFESDASVGSALVEMYSKCGSFPDAVSVFNRLPSQEDAAWSALIIGYAEHGHCVNAFEVLHQMQTKGVEPDGKTLVSILRACSSNTTIHEGKLMHAFIVESGQELHTYIANNVVDMYVKCGSLEDAKLAFERLPEQDIVTWSIIIAGCAQLGNEQLALKYFWKMQQVGVVPDEVAYVSVLKACSGIAALDQGKIINTCIVQSGYESDVLVGNSLILMYTKSGSVEDAYNVFMNMSKRDLVTWNTMMGGHAQGCDYELAEQCFKGMQQEGLRPNGVTFLHLLRACSHVGLSERGYYHLKSMRKDYHIVPTVEHYDCMVDLLGRTGNLSDAEDCLETMPFGCNFVGWTSLLSNCRNFGDFQLAKRCFDLVILVDFRSATGYALMSSMYVHVGMLEDAEEVEELRQFANAWKKPGKAFIEVDNVVHDFIVGGQSHPRSQDIYAKLDMLTVQMKEEGYVPLLDTVLQPLSSEDKEDTLCGHCERLALAFGLISTPQGTTIRISKNLRVCIDCHNATKIISKIERREIVITDTYFIHEFRDGICSCKDTFEHKH